MPANPSLGWERLQNVFYSLRDCYGLAWTHPDQPDEPSELPAVNLDQSLVAIAPFASHIAVYSHTILQGTTQSVDVYSGSGVLVHSVPWLSSIGDIVALGWSDQCALVVVMRTGKWRIYRGFDGDFDEYDLGLQGGAVVVEAKFWDRGFVALSPPDSFTCVEYDTPTAGIPLALPSSEESIGVVGWTVFPSAHDVQLMVSTETSILLLSQGGTSHDTAFGGNSRLLTVSSSGELVAVYNAVSDEITITTADFGRVLNVLKCKPDAHPTQLAWCGNDAVVVTYKDEMKLVGPVEDSLDFYLDSPAHVRCEADGLFVLTNESLRFLSRVPSVTLNTFKIGSTSPSAILLDAVDLLDQHSPKANENIEIIGDKLVEAVDECIRAAAEEFEPYWQKKLLRAASFGKTTIDLYNADEFVDTCNVLRVLNIVRQPEHGIFLTFSQYMKMGSEKLIRLLLLRRQHALCFQLAEFLDLPKQQIYLDWATCKIRASTAMTDDQLAALMIKRLAKKGVSFASVAEVAFQEGRKLLSVKMLNEETETAKSIPLLLEMDEDEYALLKAEDDMDIDSILYVLLTVYNKLSLADFFKMLDGKPNASGLFKANLSDLDGNLLYNYYYQDDYIPGLAELDLHRFFQRDKDGDSLDLRKADLHKTARLLLRSKSTQAEGKRLNDEVSLIKDQDRLNTDEIVPTNKYEPAMKTLERILLVDLRRATKFHKDHKIPERQFYYKVLNTLAKTPERRAELYEFATSKKSPIGYVPFYVELLRRGDKRQAAMYVRLCTELSPKARVCCYMKCEDYKGAIDEATKRKDVSLLEAIRAVLTNQAYLRMVDDSLETIRGTRRFG